jgi:multisubunit Na+/H+ antiporter MnhB subunit
MSSVTKGIIRFGVACVLCLSYPVMVYLAFNADASMTAVMIGGYVTLVIILLYGSDPLVEIIEAWRG